MRDVESSDAKNLLPRACQILLSTDVRPTRDGEHHGQRRIDGRRSSKHGLTETVVRQWQLVWHVSQ